MIITISGALGSGKSTVAKILAEKFNLKHYSTGGLMRQMAIEKGMTLLELSKIAEKERWVDKELDERQTELGKSEDDFIIDGRLSWHFIPNSIKIYLDVKDEIAAERIWKDKDNRQKEGFSTYEGLLKELKERKASEIKRYKKLYNLNHHDKSNYDIVIDTSSIDQYQVAEKIVQFIRSREKR